MSEVPKSNLSLDLQLSDRETYLIGMIVSHWGALEYEVFTQTLLSFDDSNLEAVVLPKAMNNIQFTQVLALWKERVVDKCQDARGSVLRDVYAELLAMKDPRDALVHGMWQWSSENLQRISTVRVKKRDIITTHFDAEYLEDFAFSLAKLNFRIRYPQGPVDLAASRESDGFYISRRFLQTISDMAAAKSNPRESADA